MNNKIKAIFMGTADFAIPSFKKILKDDRFEVVACFTQPDKPIGRSAKLQKTPIKILAEENNIPVFQPEKLSDYSTYSSDNIFPLPDVDIIIVVSYAQMIPKKILDIPKYGCVNVHGSLLPKYRGSSCVQASILNGDTKSGATIMKMDIGMDTGNILRQAEVLINHKETTATLFSKISEAGAEILPDTLLDYIEGKITPQKQDDSKSSIVKKTIKEDGRIKWDNSANYIEKQIRAMTTWPGAWTMIDEKVLKILEAELTEEKFENKEPGQIFSENKNLYIKTGEGVLKIKELQVEGKKAISAIDFINGRSDLLKTILK